MKKIGFIDYYLDEWHANNYPAWIADPRHGGRYKVAYGWAEIDSKRGLTTEQWCAKYGVEQCSSQQALIDKSDCIVVLSPDNPERHEELTRLALLSGKPVYVDKTFALSRASARRMFELADAHGTPMYSTSPLRYASELDWLRENRIAQKDIVFASTLGPGHTGVDNYLIHQIEMIVSAMGPGAKRAMAPGGRAPAVVYEYRDGRSASAAVLATDDFSIALQSADDKCGRFNIKSDIWAGFVDALLAFFDTGVSPVSQAETCEAVAMVEAALAALKRPGEWVDVK